MCQTSDGAVSIDSAVEAMKDFFEPLAALGVFQLKNRSTADRAVARSAATIGSAVESVLAIEEERTRGIR
jgi:hypothetical protein